MSRQLPRVSRDKLTGVVVALLCLALSAIGLKLNEPPEFIYVDGRRDSVVSIERARLIVGEVSVGTRLIRDGQLRAETTGMFIQLSVTLEVPGHENVSLNRTRLVTRDRTYQGWSSDSIAADAGFRTTRDMTFEVDPQQIDDLSLEIWEGAVIHGPYQRARIHLGITAENAEQWRQAAPGRELETRISGTTEGLS